MNDRSDLDWLADQRPAPLRLDPTTTDRVRDELLTKVASAGPGPTRRRARMPRRTMRIAASVAVVAALAIVALLAGPSGGAQHGDALVQNASATQLSRLTTRLAGTRTSAGDATLVTGTTTTPDGRSSTSIELFTDAGNAYDAASMSGLATQVRDNHRVNRGPDVASREIAIAKAAGTPTPTRALTQSRDLVRPLRAQFQMAGAGTELGVTPAMFEPPADEHGTAMAYLRPWANAEWDNSVAALLAGAGNPQVRAGVLKLLMALDHDGVTTDTIAVTRGMLDGRPALILTAQIAISAHADEQYTETLTIDARTGVPMRLTRGVPGQRPTTTDYTVSRVTIRSIENG